MKGRAHNAKVHTKPEDQPRKAIIDPSMSKWEKLHLGYSAWHGGRDAKKPPPALTRVTPTTTKREPKKPDLEKHSETKKLLQMVNHRKKIVTDGSHDDDDETSTDSKAPARVTVLFAERTGTGPAVDSPSLIKLSVTVPDPLPVIVDDTPALSLVVAPEPAQDHHLHLQQPTHHPLVSKLAQQIFDAIEWDANLSTEYLQSTSLFQPVVRIQLIAAADAVQPGALAVSDLSTAIQVFVHEPSSSPLSTPSTVSSVPIDDYSDCNLETEDSLKEILNMGVDGLAYFHYLTHMTNHDDDSMPTSQQHRLSRHILHNSQVFIEVMLDFVATILETHHNTAADDEQLVEHLVEHIAHHDTPSASSLSEQEVDALHQHQHQHQHRSQQINLVQFMVLLHRFPSSFLVASPFQEYPIIPRDELDLFSSLFCVIDTTSQGSVPVSEFQTKRLMRFEVVADLTRAALRRKTHCITFRIFCHVCHRHMQGSPPSQQSAIWLLEAGVDVDKYIEFLSDGSLVPTQAVHDFFVAHDKIKRLSQADRELCDNIESLLAKADSQDRLTMTRLQFHILAVSHPDCMLFSQPFHWPFTLSQEERNDLAAVLGFIVTTDTAHLIDTTFPAPFLHHLHKCSAAPAQLTFNMLSCVACTCEAPAKNSTDNSPSTPAPKSNARFDFLGTSSSIFSAQFRSLTSELQSSVSSLRVLEFLSAQQFTKLYSLNDDDDKLEVALLSEPSHFWLSFLQFYLLVSRYPTCVFLTQGPRPAAALPPPAIIVTGSLGEIGQPKFTSKSSSLADNVDAVASKFTAVSASLFDALDPGSTGKLNKDSLAMLLMEWSSTSKDRHHVDVLFRLIELLGHSKQPFLKPKEFQQVLIKLSADISFMIDLAKDSSQQISVEAAGAPPHDEAAVATEVNDDAEPLVIAPRRFDTLTTLISTDNPGTLRDVFESFNPDRSRRISKVRLSDGFMGLMGALSDPQQLNALFATLENVNVANELMTFDDFEKVVTNSDFLVHLDRGE